MIELTGAGTRRLLWVAVVPLLIVSACGLVDDRREAVRADSPEPGSSPAMEVVRPSVATTVPLPAVERPSAEEPPEQMSPGPETAPVDPGPGGEPSETFMEELEALGPQCTELGTLIFLARGIFDDGANPTFALERELFEKVLVQVAALVGGFPQPVAGSDALLTEIGAAVEQVRAATTARELYTPLLVVLERHGDSVDEVFASLNATCVLPEQAELVRPAAMLSDWLRSELA